MCTCAAAAAAAAVAAVAAVAAQPAVAAQRAWWPQAGRPRASRQARRPQAGRVERGPGPVALCNAVCQPAGVLLVSVPTTADGWRWVWDAVAGDPRHVLREATRPRPHVAQHQHRRHVALRHLRQQIVQPCHHRFVVHARRRLHRRQNPPRCGCAEREPRLAIGPLARRQHAYVADAERLQPVQLAQQPRPVAADGASRAEVHRIPHVGADEAVRLAEAVEPRAVDSYERPACRALVGLPDYAGKHLRGRGGSR